MCHYVTYMEDVTDMTVGMQRVTNLGYPMSHARKGIVVE